MKNNKITNNNIFHINFDRIILYISYYKIFTALKIHNKNNINDNVNSLLSQTNRVRPSSNSAHEINEFNKPNR
jgi:hypothetical protein